MEIRQDPKAWQAGYEAGQAGKTPPLPPGVDGLAFYSGVIEGQAVRGKNIPQRESPAQVLPFPGANAPDEIRLGPRSSAHAPEMKPEQRQEQSLDIGLGL